ncbi:phage tail protein [Sporolactobacillus sp. CQH2019]|uniref:phage tail spike protein n=1 Tax=Sporolactobacillus sp. CQH2019 TaxID=3023512 RepID=UPI002368F018|nr:phage tail spike protein [Sporolactobacillus sp. CQH2019]MDD9149341.1 phage tail protein [Sporolactobacillus sp. CQH2019]
MIYILTPDKKVVTVLSNDGGLSCPFYNDLHVEQLIEFDSTYTFTSPTEYDQTQSIVVGNYAAILDLDNEIQLFRITNTDDGFDNNGKTIIATCENAAIFDLNGTLIRPGHDFSGMMAKDQFAYILQDTGWEMGYCDVIDSQTPSIDSYATAQAALHSVVDAYNGNVKFRIELSGNQISHQYIDFLKQRGTSSGKRFEYSKDLQGVQRTINITDNFATALIPQGANDSAGNPINITSVNSGLDYIANDEANQLYNPLSDKYIYKLYTNDKMTTPGALLADAQKQLAIVSKPETTYDCSVLLLEQIAGFEHEAVRLGDTVNVIDKDMNPTLTVQARIIEMDVSYSDHTADKVVLGDYVPIQDITPTLVSKIQAQVSDALSKIDMTNIKVEISASNGSIFKNSQGTTDLIARVYNGKTSITSDLQPSNFVWNKVQADGSHDTAWEQAHTESGNTVMINASDVYGEATFTCSINL